MYSYEKITQELIDKAGIKYGDVHIYDAGDFSQVYEQYFNFCQTNLLETYAKFNSHN
jgi:hypothetical protein